ncbi:hypothetical protein BKA65DRAFT_75903 [Rhexocercosporidium sp. MPI-PUGE-AT-0058]|nr:hypothetical protein BKA65DRAFT_75903 [Rhexocercosporidium sp. MPI-PUGE-AT-0058]
MSEGDFALQRTFLSHLVDRRNRLLELALETLPNFELENLNLREDRVLDAQAAAVTALLLQRGIEIDSALMPSSEPRKTTVYHASPLSLQMAKNLYEAGFRDMDETDADGWTPFWRHAYAASWNFESLEVLQWLKEKNVDVYLKLPHRGGMAVHALGAYLGNSFFHGQRYPSRARGFTEQHAKIAGSFLGDEVVDDCECACSKNGCRTITSALKHCRNWYSNFETLTGEYRKKDVRLLSCLSILQLVEDSIPERPWIPLEVIRIMTFEWLELTHTCHVDPESLWDKIRGPLSNEEIHEIQEEERDLLQQHEDLVAEFESKYTELGLPLSTFLEEYWAPRMDQVLKSSDELSLEEERTRMRALGIVIPERDRIEEVHNDSITEEDVEEVDDVREDADAEVDSGTEDFHDCEDIPDDN